MKVKEEREKAGFKLNIQKTKIMASSPTTLWQIWGKKWKQWQVLFSWAPKSPQIVTAAMKLKDTCSLEEKLWPTETVCEKAETYLPRKVHLVKAMVSPVVMYVCENWTIKKAECQRIDVFELWCWGRPLSSLDCKEIQSVKRKGNQSWIFTGRTNAEAPILWPLDKKN